jgi:hypothetical protein
MLEIFIFIGIIFIFAGGVMIALSLPLIKRQVKMNALYGIRIGKSFESEEAWYAINEYGGRVLMRLSYVWFAGGIASIVMGIVFPANAPSSTLILGILLVVPMVATLVCLIPIVRFANKV